MSTSMVRVSDTSKVILKELASKTGKTMQSLLEEAIEKYRRWYLLEQHNRAYASLQKNENAWKEELEERKIWDQTLRDDLEEEDHSQNES